VGGIKRRPGRRGERCPALAAAIWTTQAARGPIRERQSTDARGHKGRGDGPSVGSGKVLNVLVGEGAALCRTQGFQPLGSNT